jgi:hypothetical protein
MHLTREPDVASLVRVCECCGFMDVGEMINCYLFKESCPAFCLSCGYIEEQAPETFAGWCPVCDTDTMRSALVLAGIL